jgi:choline dehydrogenase-like flavoprotein
VGSPAPVSFGIQAPTLRSDTNYMDLDPEVKDPYGIPVARMHFEWDENALKMWEHSKQVCAEVLKASGGELEESGDAPEIPGFSLHETGTCRMGNDPKKFVSNRFLTCTDKTTTISILAFTLRTSQHLIENFRRGEQPSA